MGSWLAYSGAKSPSDALERACYSLSKSSGKSPEEVNLHSVYDENENLIWVDEPYYALIQKKHEFRGLERRSFLSLFGKTTAAILYGIVPIKAFAGSAAVTLSGTASGFSTSGSQLYTSGSGNWIAPISGNISVLCIGAGGGGAQVAGGGGGLGYNSFTVTSGTNYSYSVGAGGLSNLSGTLSAGGNTSFLTLTAYGGNPGSNTWSGPAVGTGGGSSGGSGGGTGGTGGRADGSSNWPGGGGSGGYDVMGGTGASNLASTYSGQTSPANAGAGGGSGSLSGKGVGIFGIGDPNPTTYGGGGAYTSGYAGNGVIRIIWGSGRSYPSNAT